MSYVIPYDDNLGRKERTFITPSGKIVSTPMTHEFYATEYCRGEGFLDGSNGVSRLTAEEAAIFKNWLSEYGYKRELCSDFLVQVLGFDKVETVLRRVITTTSREPHVRFYNYYLMDWCIDNRRPIRYNEETGLFEYDKSDEWISMFNGDKAVEDEINEIKANVLVKERHYFFK